MQFRFNSIMLISHIIFLTLISAPSALALTDPISSPQENIHLFLEGSYFNTTANYDNGGGSYTKLTGSRYYRLYEGNFGAEFWPMEQLSLIGQLGVARAQSYDGDTTRTKINLTEGLVGVRYVVKRSFFNLIPELNFSYPFKRINSDTDEVLLNEGTMKFFGGTWFEIPYKSLVPYGQVGFRYQDEGRASYFIYKAGVAWTPSDFRVSGELYGDVVVIDDEDSNQTSRRDLTVIRVDGGSRKFYGVNPTVLGLRAATKMNLSNAVQIGFTFDKTINGNNSAAGWTALLSLEAFFSIGNTFNSNDGKYVPRVLNPTQDVQRFVPELPKYDKKLFNEYESPVSHKKIKKKKRKKPTPQDVDKALEDVQKSLEH